MVREEFGRTAGRQIVIEKRLDGEEVSVPAPALVHRQHTVVGGCGRQHAVGVGHGEAHGLFDHDMFAGVEQRDG